jgi:hypothetical protein
VVVVEVHSTKLVVLEVLVVVELVLHFPMRVLLELQTQAVAVAVDILLAVRVVLVL